MNDVYDLMIEGLRILFLIGVPLVAGATFAGLLASIVQSFFAIQDATVSYALRLVSVVIVFSVLSVSVIGSFQALLVRALTP